MKELTLVYLVRVDTVCLAMKKRGFGEGYYNGYGGKVEACESIVDAAVREVREESLCVLSSKDLTQVADLTFYFSDNTHHVTVYCAENWSGEPQETEEMKPDWFPFSEIPYESMWADDAYWLPRVLRGERLVGEVWFAEDQNTITDMRWQSVVQF